jgi:hypothetical protein
LYVSTGQSKKQEAAAGVLVELVGDVQDLIGNQERPTPRAEGAKALTTEGSAEQLLALEVALWTLTELQPGAALMDFTCPGKVLKAAEAICQID